ncbi:MAG: response regulator [Nitrospirota bacterium]
MPVKLLLADKSITIQKVVEMLFSGKEYEVSCVSDGESAMADALRIVPDVVLADVDLPRIDGYSFAGKMRETPSLSKVPVILMLSRDDVYDAMKGKLSGIVDTIAKPFESQDLIGKVKKALSAAPAPVAERPAAALAPKPVVAPPPPPPKPVAAPPPPPKPVAVPPPPVAPPPPKPREAVPKDIFDIIEEAPAPAGAKEAPQPSPQAPEKTAKQAGLEESTFDVEPEYEVEPEFDVEPEAEQPAAAAARSDDWAVMAAEAEAARAAAAAEPDAFDTDQIFGKEPAPAEEAPAAVLEPARERGMPSPEPAAPPSFDFSEPLPAEAEKALPLGQKAMDEMREGLGLAGDAAAARHPDIVTFESLDMASRASHEDYTFSPPDAGVVAPAAAPAPPAPPAAAGKAAPSRTVPEIPEEMLRGAARESMEKAMREVLERVAWEIIPDLAERLIREEIERLKAEK